MENQPQPIPRFPLLFHGGKKDTCANSRARTVSEATMLGKFFLLHFFALFAFCLIILFVHNCKQALCGESRANGNFHKFRFHLLIDEVVKRGGSLEKKKITHCEASDFLFLFPHTKHSTFFSLHKKFIFQKVHCSLTAALHTVASYMKTN
jgi:hypothetical protein